MANTTWIVKIENASGKDLKYVNGEDPKRTGIIKTGKRMDFEGSGFCFPWVDIAKGELKKSIKFYEQPSNKFLFAIYQSWNRDRLEWIKLENGTDKDVKSLAPDSSMGDRKAVSIDNTMTPKAYNQYPNYNRFQSYYNNWMNMTHKEYYKSSPGDTGLNGIQISDFLTEIWTELKYPAGSNFLESESFLNGLTVESWHIDIARQVLDTNDLGIEHYAGLAIPWRILISTNGPGSYGGTVSHEIGHQYQNSITKNNTSIGSYLKNTYKTLRQVDFTANTPEFERFAEDFRFFFGVKGIRGNLTSTDDHYTSGGKIRKPDAVKGLKELMRGSWPVFNYLRNRNFTNYAYKDSSFTWYANNRWECFNAVTGGFSWHNGKEWVKF
jgi:hypothetical protein